MSKAELYSKGFLELAVELGELKAQAERDVEQFKSQVERYKDWLRSGRPKPQGGPLRDQKRLLLGNRIREAAGRPTIRPIRERVDDIQDLINDPNEAARLFRGGAAAERVSHMAEKAGRLTIEAFCDGVLVTPHALWFALKTDRSQKRWSENGSGLWDSVVVPSLMKTFPGKFPADSDSDWPGFSRFRAACQLLATNLGRSAPAPTRPRGRPRNLDTELDRRIESAWLSDSYRKYKDLAEALETTEAYVTKVLNRVGKRKKKLEATE